MILNYTSCTIRFKLPDISIWRLYEQVGPYNATKNYIFDAQAAEYVSFANPSSAIPQFQVEGFYRLAESASPGENPETHPDHWVYQGTVLGDIAIDDVNGLREELNWAREMIGSGNKERAYTLDFGLHGELVQEINMLGECSIINLIFNNVDKLFLTNSNNVRVEVSSGVNGIILGEYEVNTWEINRIVDQQVASVGVLITK